MTIADDEVDAGLDDLWEQLAHRDPSEPRRKRRKRPEAKVQKAIIQWLLARGVILAVTDAGVAHRLGIGVGTGIPTGWGDITGCLPCGRFLMVECKAPKGRQTDIQKTYQTAIEKNGGLYILAHSLGELVTAFRAEESLHNPVGISLDKLCI